MAACDLKSICNAFRFIFSIYVYNTSSDKYKHFGNFPVCKQPAFTEEKSRKNNTEHGIHKAEN
jgi:hypothetical protein